MGEEGYVHLPTIVNSRHSTLHGLLRGPLSSALSACFIHICHVQTCSAVQLASMHTACTHAMHRQCFSYRLKGTPGCTLPTNCLPIAEISSSDRMPETCTVPGAI